MMTRFGKRKTRYRNFVLETAMDKSLANATLGLCAEAGEVANLLKKESFQGKTIARDAYLDELGDVRWYLELACEYFGVTLKELEERNIEKLSKRYGVVA